MNKHLQNNDEIALHNHWAENCDPSEIDIMSVMEGVNAVENRFLVNSIHAVFGNTLKGLRILDVGTGLGESAVYFAKQGATVTATDISPGMISLCRKLAKQHKVTDKIEFIVSSAELLPRNKGRYDIIYAVNLLHHLKDAESFMKTASNNLKSPGLFLSYDPIESNPAVNVYRKLAQKVRSANERPLEINFVKTVSKYFSSIKHREFWFFAQLLFLKYYFVNHIDPNDTRYWKLIHYKRNRCGERVMKFLHAVDRIPLSFPLINSWAWNMAIVARR